MASPRTVTALSFVKQGDVTTLNFTLDDGSTRSVRQTDEDALDALGFEVYSTDPEKVACGTPGWEPWVAWYFDNYLPEEEEIAELEAKVPEAPAASPIPEAAPAHTPTTAPQAAVGGFDAKARALIAEAEAMTQTDPVGDLLLGKVGEAKARIEALEPGAATLELLRKAQAVETRKGVQAAIQARIDWHTLVEGKVAEIKPRIAAETDVERLRVALTLDSRSTVVKALEARITELAPEQGDNPAPGIQDGDVRPELGGSIEGGVGRSELGGSIEGGLGTELGGGLGTGQHELAGELGGGSVVGPEGSIDEEAGQFKRREGAGCKQPWEVEGFEPGRILVSIRTHRGRHAHWGRTEYRVKCLEEGGFELVGIDGGRADDLKVGRKWPYATPMFYDLMGIPEKDPDTGKKNRHRMTLTRFFRLGKG